MIVQWLLFSILLLLLFARCKLIAPSSSCALDKNTTATVNGFFIAVVFIHHFCGYCRPSINSFMGNLFKQLMVTSFLFYSGYGCSIQFLSRGNEYIRTFPVKRIFATVFKFDLAVCIFILLRLLLGGGGLGLNKAALSLVAWDSVGNSNWYIFAIVFCYVCFYVVFAIASRFRLNNLFAGIFLVLPVCAYVVVMTRLKPPWWYDTIMAFPLGVVIGLYKDMVFEFMRKYYWASLIILVGIMAATRYLPGLGCRHWVEFNIKSMAFAIVIVMVTMRIRLDSPALRWCGRHLFALYIYQRLPMVFFATLYPFAFQSRLRWVFFIFSLIISVAIAWSYEKVGRLCKKL